MENDKKTIEETPKADAQKPATQSPTPPVSETNGADLSAKDEEIELLIIKVGTLEEVINDQNERLNEATALIKELQAGSTIAVTVTKTVDLPIVTIDKKKFTFKYPAFAAGGTNYRAAEVAKDAKLCQKLYESNPSVFLPA